MTAINFNFKFKDNKISVEVEPESLDNEGFSQALSDGLKKAITRDSYFELFNINADRTSDEEQAEFLNALEKANANYAEFDDKEPREDVIASLVFQEIEKVETNDAYEYVESIYGDVDDLFDSFVEGLRDSKEELELAGFDIEEVGEGVFSNSEEVDQLFHDGVYNSNQTTVKEYLKTYGKIVMSYNHNASPSEDTMITMLNSMSEPGYVYPDEPFKDMLRMLNVAPDVFVKALSDHTGGDMLDFDHSENANQWEQVIDEVEYDPSKPSLVEVQKLVNALKENESLSYIQPSIIFNIDNDLLMDMDPSNRTEISGAILALTDFVNGAGDVLYLDNDFVIENGSENLIQAEGPNAVGYGILESIGYEPYHIRTDVTIKDPNPDYQHQEEISF